MQFSLFVLATLAFLSLAFLFASFLPSSFLPSFLPFTHDMKRMTSRQLGYRKKEVQQTAAAATVTLKVV
jgi:hypothetical protein